MSVAGVVSSALFSLLNPAQNTRNSGQNNFQQIQTDFRQLGQDLQSGNLSQAQQDFATLQQALPNPTAFAQSQSNNPIVQAFNALSQDLQGGNLRAAQQDFATLQQDLQQNANAPQVHHHHHGGGRGEENQISQAFQSLSQALQSNNLSGAQSAFATLEQDFSQIGGLTYPNSSSNNNASSTQNTSGSLNVTA
jgi:hypothetical protein